MAKKFSDFSASDLQRLATSDAGQQLMNMLQTDHSTAAEAARQSAQQGDYGKMQTELTDFMEDPRAKALLRQLWEEYYG